MEEVMHAGIIAPKNLGGERFIGLGCSIGNQRKETGGLLATEMLAGGNGGGESITLFVEEVAIICAVKVVGGLGYVCFGDCWNR